MPAHEREYRFHPTRKWRADFAWPERHLLVEVEGGIWVAGRHNRGSGFEADCHKYNAAALGGWRVLRFTPRMIRDGTALAQIEAALALAGPYDAKVGDDGRKYGVNAQQLGWAASASGH